MVSAYIRPAECTAVHSAGRFGQPTCTPRPMYDLWRRAEKVLKWVCSKFRKRKRGLIQWFGVCNFRRNECMATPPHHQIGGRIWLTSPICSADLLGFWISPTCSADLWGFCDLADSFCRLVEACGILGHLIWRCHSKMCSFTLGHWVIPFLSILVVQIGTMKCFYCPQKDASVVPWDSLSPDDQNFLRDKYPDAGQGAVCYLCVRSARPSAFFSHHSSSTSSSAPQISGFWAATAFGSSSCVWCSHIFGHRVNVPMHCAVPCRLALCPCSVPMHCAHALCPCAHALCHTLCPCTVPMRGIWGCRAFGVCCRVFY